MQVVSRVRSALAVELPVRAIFEAPTVAQLVTRLAEARKVGPPLVRQERPERLPLSFAQQRLWFLDQLENSGCEYNMRAALRLRGELDVSALERAIRALIGCHEILRTRFDEYEGKPFQVIEPEVRIPLRVEDLSSLGGSERQEAIESALRREAEEPFDLREGPLLRMGLLRLEACDHILVWSCHHISSDGWSIAVFHRHLWLAYEAFREGGNNPLEPLPVQYADYALWQRGWMQGEVLEGLLEYWRGQLAGAATLELPADRPRPPRPSYSGARCSFELGAELSERLAEFNRREKVTAFMSLLAAFEVLLYRYSDQSDFTVGTPVANRGHVEVEGLVGFFVNSLVMRADLAGEPSFRELVGRVRRAALDAYEHQDLPFEKLVEELNPKRDMSRHPLFQVMFALQNAPREALKLSGLEVTRRLLASSTTRFDLELHLWAQGDGWSGSLIYSRDLFEEASIEAMVRHYVALLEGMLEEPERAVSLVPMMAEAERKRILVQWNATRVDYPRDRCIHEVFEEQVERTPEAIAVLFGDKTLTYRDLNIRSNRLAHNLRALGVGPDVLVGLCIERSQEMIVGLLGILKAGAAYVPIDPTHPRDRLTFIMADAGARKLITGKTRRPWLEECAAEVVRLNSEVSAGPDDAPAVMPVSPDSLAYILYTSGSTGQPKGVEVTHRSVVNLLHSLAETPGVTEADTVLALTTLSFDISVAEIFLPLSVGARIILAGEEAAVDVTLLKQLIEESQPTIIQATPSRWRLLLEAGWRAKPDLKIFCTGEALPRELTKQLTAMSPSVWNLYGPTETTVFSSIARVEEGPIHVGRPIANTRTYILDANSNPMPVGVPGELYIGGLGVSRGYRNRPELTAEKFLADPFDPDRKGRLFRTGDAARYLSGGEIEYLGRLDNQVKIRGFRIELGEIESVLMTYPGVRQAAVCVRERGGAEDKQLVGYVVMVQGSSTSSIEQELRAFLKNKLPDYMVPTAFVLLEKLPLTSTGKIDRHALPAPALVEERMGTIRPRDATERMVADAWSAVLDGTTIGVYDDFFQLGGHSLLAMRVVSRLRSASGLDIPLRVFFENASVAALAEYIEAARRTLTGTGDAPLVVDREELVL
jgi:amino acid adenylation domain-containing protein